MFIIIYNVNDLYLLFSCSLAFPFYKLHSEILFYIWFKLYLD